MQPTPTAVFFDLDGTILDWQKGMEERWRTACEEHCDGSFVPAEMYQAIRVSLTRFWDDTERARTGRMDLDEASRMVVRHAFSDSGLANADLANRIADEYRARRAATLAPYPGAIETLDAIRDRAIPMALLTNGESANQRQSVEKLGLAPYFDCIVIEGEFGVGKPDERVFRHALRALSSSPETTWMIGDNLESDIAPALALGMHSVWVDAEGQGLAADAAIRPDRVVQAISELV